MASKAAVVVVILCFCATLTLAMDGLWFGSLPDVVETTPVAVEMKTSRISSAKHRTRPSPGNATRYRVTQLKRRVNASSANVTSTVQRVKNVSRVTPMMRKNQTSPSFEAKMEEVTYWETGGASDGQNNQTEDEVSVKEHDRSPHPAGGGAGSGGGSWFGRFKNPASSSSQEQAEPVAVAGYQSGGEPEATVHIKEHDEPGVGAGAHFAFSAAGGEDESALWFGGGLDGDHVTKTDTPSFSSSRGGSGNAGGGGGGGDSGAWFGLDNWSALSLEPNAGHRQQRRLSYRQAAEEIKNDDIITAPPPSSRDTFSFVVNSNLGGDEEDESQTTSLPPLFEDEIDSIITAEPSVAEDSWFEEETTSVTPPTIVTTATTTTTTTAKHEVNNNNGSYIVGISKISSVNEQHSVIDFVEQEEPETTTTMPSTTVTLEVTQNEVVTESLFQNVSESESSEATTSKYSFRDETTTSGETTTVTNREGREFETDTVVINDSGDAERKNLTKSAVVISANPPKIIKNDQLASESMMNHENKDNTAYIIVGTCCALSLLCLIIVVVILRYRKSVRRRQSQNRFHHYPIDRDPRFRHFEANSWAERPTTSGHGHKNHQQFTTSPPPATTTVLNPSKTRNLWFIGQKRSAPYSLYEQQHQQNGGYTVDHQDVGGHVTQSTSAHHFSGSDTESKGELIHWSTNSEQLI